MRLRLRSTPDDVAIEMTMVPAFPNPSSNGVLEPFFRAETSWNRDTAGIGPGLTTVRSIVLDHDGFRVIVSLPLLGQ